MSLADPHDSPAPGLRERKRQQTLDHLSQTAYRLFETLGYEVVTMEQIAAQADVSKGTLYNHFPVKGSPAGAPLPRRAGRQHGGPAAQAAHGARLCRAAQACPARLRALVRSQPRLSRALPALPPVDPAPRRPGRRPLTRSGLQTLFHSLITQGQQAGQLRADLPADLLTHQLQFLHLGALLRWLDLPGASLRREFDALLSLFLQGAAPSGSAA